MISNGFTSGCELAKEWIDKECDGSGAELLGWRGAEIRSAVVTESSVESESSWMDVDECGLSVASAGLADT